MSGPLEIVRIAEWPWGKTTWVYLREAAEFVGLEVPELRKICDTIGAKIIEHHYGETRRASGLGSYDRKWAEFIDFGVLGRSASWRQLVGAKEAKDSQQVLF